MDGEIVTNASVLKVLPEAERPQEIVYCDARIIGHQRLRSRTVCRRGPVSFDQRASPLLVRVRSRRLRLMMVGQGHRSWRLGRRELRATLPNPNSNLRSGPRNAASNKLYPLSWIV